MSDQVKQEVIETARAIRSGAIDLVRGCRVLCNLRHYIGASDNKLFFPIVAFESDTDDYPLGAVRQSYNPATLERLDREIETYIRQTKSEVLEACQRIIESLS